MKTGKLIVFEGADEVGKTTLAAMLAESLLSRSLACEVVGFPGNEVGTLGFHVNEFHHDSARFQVKGINPTSLQMLHVAAHIDAIDRRIIPALRKSRIVILDRFWWSSWVYGTVNGANKESLEAVIRAESIHWMGIKPSRVFLITSQTPFEKQADLGKWKRISALYRKFASREQRKYPVTVIENKSTL
ncbi:MAG TPA: hypothetical protein VN765_11975, partial [Candidatus Acidoferrum sp.]|nr:hypothetical protein [Candidatus Acidoferrum sp.]